jgi:hypothetical protein
VRSLKPSGIFAIETQDADGYVIDRGGQDIIILMREMAEFGFVWMTSSNNVNGEQTTLLFNIGFRNPLNNGDKLIVELPKEIRFVKAVKCKTIEGDLKLIGCAKSGQLLTVTIKELDENLDSLAFEVDGVNNPPSYRPSKPIVACYTTDKEGWRSQQARDLSELVLSTEKPGKIT